MELNHTIFPKEFNDALLKSLSLILFPLEKFIEKELGREEIDFRILINRNKVAERILDLKLEILDNDKQFKIRKEILRVVASEVFTTPGVRSIHFSFFSKNDSSVIEKLEKSASLGINSSNNKFLEKELTSFVPIESRYSFDKIYMPESQKTDILRTLNTLKNHELIYKIWGFEEIDPAARSILNFYGPPGTGKTMTAHAIAAELGIKILELNYAEIESKYVGDAAKNMVNAFNTAKKENALLFFDEADSFLSRRSTSGTSASEQSMNSQRSQMLMLLENFKGIVVFCTNLIKNYDPAFESRILKSIKFELPDENARKEILKKSIPVKLPFKNDEILQEDDYCELAKIIEGFSGREIKNAVLKTLCFVAEKEEKCFEFADFKLCFENAKKEFDEMKSARGPNKEKLAQEISENLKNKNYAEVKEKSDSFVEQ